MLTLVGCASCPPPPGAVDTAAAPAAIDVDSVDRDRLVHVRLEAVGGTLWVHTDADPDAAEIGDGEEPPCPEPWEWESRQHATWEAGVTVLPARAEAASDDGTPGGWMGMALPLGDGRAVAVRSWTVGWGRRAIGERDDELVAITFPDVTVRPLYAPGGRLRLMGVVSGHPLLLVSSRDGAHRVAAVDASGREIARTEAVVPPEEVLESTAMPATEVGDAVPVDATTIAFACTPAREVCTVSFDGRALALARTGVVLGAQDALVVADGVSHVARGASCTPLLAGGPSARCEDLPLEDGPGLSVDGVLADDLECDVLASLARDSVAIDPREPETDADVAARSRAGVVAALVSEVAARRRERAEHREARARRADARRDRQHRVPQGPRQQ